MKDSENKIQKSVENDKYKDLHKYFYREDTDGQFNGLSKSNKPGYFLEEDKPEINTEEIPEDEDIILQKDQCNNELEEKNEENLTVEAENIDTPINTSEDMNLDYDNQDEDDSSYEIDEKPKINDTKENGIFENDEEKEKFKENCLCTYAKSGDLPKVVTVAGKFNETVKLESKEYSKDRKQPLNNNIKDSEDVEDKKFKMFGEIEEKDEEYNPDFHDTKEVIEDYTGEQDSFSIKSDINKNLRKVFLRTIITLCITMITVALTIFERMDLEFTHKLNIPNLPMAYLCADILLLLIAILLSLPTIINGMGALLKLKSNSDSTVALASILSFIQLTVALFDSQRFANGGLYIYYSLAVIGLFLNSLGKLYIILRVKDNFKFVSSPFKKYSLQSLTDEKTTKKIVSDPTIKHPVLGYQKETDLLANFLKISYTPDKNEFLASVTGPIALISSFAFAITKFILTKDIFIATGVLALVSCICIPMNCLISINGPMRKLCKRMLKKGGMVSGFLGINKFSGVNCVMLDAEDLYPNRSITLQGIKTFSNLPIDKAILSATALVNSLGGPIYSIFEQIVQGKKDILPIVDGAKYIDDKGMLGWVDGKRVLLGNKSLMEAYGIDALPIDQEKKYCRGSKRILYLSIGGKLIAIFILIYKPDVLLAKELQNLEKNAVTMLVKTLDPNVTAEYIAKDFDIFFKSVKIMSNEKISQFEELDNNKLEQDDAYIATKGNARTLARLVSSCIRMKANISIEIAIQAVSLVLGFVIVAILTFYSEIDKIGNAELILYTLFWTMITVMVPKVFKA